MWKTITGVLDTRKHPTDEEINKISSYMFVRWLENDPSTIMAANKLNFYHQIPMVNQYKMIKHAFGGKIRFIKYPKTTKFNERVDEIVARHFKINLEKAREYQTILPEADINEIIDLHDEMENAR